MACTVVPLLAVAYWNQFSHTIEYQRQMLQAKVEAAAQITAGELQRIDTRMHALAQQMQRIGASDAGRLYVPSPWRSPDFASFSRILVIDRLGARPVPAAPQADSGAPDPLLVEQARLVPGRIVHRVRQSADAPVVLSALAVPDRAGTDPVLYTETSVTPLLARLRRLPLGDNGFFMLVAGRDLTTQLLVHRNNIAALTPDFSQRLLASELALSSSVDLGQSMVGGCDCHAAAAQVADSGWIMISALPMHEFVSVMSRLDRAVFVVLCFVFFATYYSSSFAQRKLVRPITAITETAGSITDGGDLRQRVDWASNNEMGRLAKTFNRMLTALERSTASLEQQRLHRQRIIESIGDALFVIDADGRILETNPSASTLLDRTTKQMTHKNFSELCDGGAFIDRIRSTQARIQHSETALIRHDGSTVPCTASIASLGAADPGDEAFVIVARDISRHKETEQRLHYLANHDILTGLPNSMLLRERVEQATARLQWSGRHVAVIFIDVDNFKIVNDSMGHSEGDALLKVIAQRLTDAVRDGDTVARQGGDEFVVLLSDVAQIEDIDRVATRILTLLREPLELQGHAFSPSASLGIARFPDDAEEVDDLFRKADAAMYQVKRSGRNSYAYFSADMQLPDAPLPGQRREQV